MASQQPCHLEPHRAVPSMCGLIVANWFCVVSDPQPPLWLTGSVTQRPPRKALTNCSGMGDSR